MEAYYVHGWLPMTPGKSIVPGFQCVSTLDTLKEPPSSRNVNAYIQEQKQIETCIRYNKMGVRSSELTTYSSSPACMNNSKNMTTYHLTVDWR